MHRQLDPAFDADSDLDLDLDQDFVFDLECLDIFDTTPVTRPADEVLEEELALASGGLAQRLARLGAWSRRERN